MLRHFITTAWRNLLKYRVFSLINIGGLSLGLAAFWIISLYVADELSYDRYLPTTNRVVRAVSYADWSWGSLHTATSSPPFAATLQHTIPQVEKAVRVDQNGDGTIVKGDKRWDINGFFADSTFFDVFPYKILYGDNQNPLQGTASIVLTQSLATLLFGNPALAPGKSVVFDKDQPYLVTAVMEDVPANTHFNFSAIRTFGEDIGANPSSWDYYNIYTYLLLKKGVTIASAQAQVDRSFAPLVLNHHGAPAKGTTYRMELQPLKDIHLHSNLSFEMGRNGDIHYVYIFIAAALLILSIAAINYMNLSTARSVLRLREIGVRKVMGSTRAPLAGLFIAESVIITLFATFLGLILVELTLPLFNTLSGKNISLIRFGALPTLGVLLLGSLLLGFLAGLYPALFMSGFKVLRSLKGELGSQSMNILFRKGLVTFQFVVTIFMLSASALIYCQLRYVDHAYLGFNKDQTLSFHLHNPRVRRQFDALRARLLESPLIEGASGASNPIGTNFQQQRRYRYEKDGVKEGGSMMGKILQVDPYFLTTLQIPMAYGRNFSPQLPTDSEGAVLVNEAFVREAGWSDPIGKMIAYPVGDTGRHRARVVGVFKDFNLYSLQYKIMPLALYLPGDVMDEDNMFVRVNKDHVAEALAYLDKTYHSFDPGAAFEYHFLDQNFSRQYESERKQGYILLCFTILAVTLACMGLLGLVHFAAVQRAKEIGIRKVLGAENFGIVRLLAGDFLQLILLAGLIAGPLTWWSMNLWLQEFAYHIPVYWWVLLGSVLVAALIALVTMTSQALRAARANPIDSIKYE
jgi:putative ABC transport system permease protein